MRKEQRVNVMKKSRPAKCGDSADSPPTKRAEFRPSLQRREPHVNHRKAGAESGVRSFKLNRNNETIENELSGRDFERPVTPTHTPRLGVRVQSQELQGVAVTRQLTRLSASSRFGRWRRNIAERRTCRWVELPISNLGGLSPALTLRPSSRGG